MAVSKNEMAGLSKMWKASEAKEGGGFEHSGIPPGKFQFKILGTEFNVFGQGAVVFGINLECVGGAQEHIGKKVTDRNNISTEANMGWLKKKLNDLGVDSDSITMEAIAENTIEDELKGIVFAGTKKDSEGEKGVFENIYVDKVVRKENEVEGAEEETPETTEEEETTSVAEEEATLEVDDEVKWTIGDEEREGTVLEILEGEHEGKARVSKLDGKVVRVAIELLEIQYAADEPEPAEEEEEESASAPVEEEEEEAPAATNGNGKLKIPSLTKVQALKKSELNVLLKKLGFKHTTMKQPRLVAESIALLTHKAGAKLNIKQVKPLCEALDIKVKRGTSFGITSKTIRKEVAGRFKA